MSLKALGIEHKQLADTLVTTVHLNIMERKELQAVLDGLAQAIPKQHIAGPALCIFQFVSSVKDGFEVEAGFPVTQAVQVSGARTWTLPGVDVLSLVHTGPADQVQSSYKKLYGSAAEHALISDEFAREIYLDGNNPDESRIEIQFILHDWSRLLAGNLERVLGETSRRQVMQESDLLTLESVAGERFQWVKGAVARLDELADENQLYEILSRCAHVFPTSQIAKLHTVYEEAKAKSGDPLQAVDAVIAFMGQDPGWGKAPRREGNVIYSTKNPRNPQAYQKAQTPAERKSAACFCPLVRNHLDQGMSDSFCYCSAGWERQQWECALGRPVKVQVIQSLVRGDDVCQFAIYLPDNL